MKNIVFFFKKKKLVPEGPGTGPEGTSPPGLVFHKYMKNIVFFFKKKKLVPEGQELVPEGTSPPGLVGLLYPISE